MATSSLYHEDRFIGLEEFPPVRFSGFDHNVDVHIAQYLRDFFRKSTPSDEAPTFVIPSILDLSMYFHCHEFDILDVIETLKRQGYECDVRDFYKPIRVKTAPPPVYHMRRFVENRWRGIGNFLMQLARYGRPQGKPGSLLES